MADVIMPALGMAQDTGKLVQWLKAPGDQVAKGDVLFEVETDKSVMEVEAQADGFLTDVSAVDGEDVPVGQVIALISATAQDANAAPKARQEDAAPAPAAPTSAAPASPPAPSPAPAAPAAGVAATGDRVLASPKARRLAAEEGLELADLVAAGVPMPYHAADLATLRGLSETADVAPAEGPASEAPASRTPVGLKHITARCPRAGTRDFIDWMQTDGAITITPGAIFASFAAGAFRAATEAATVVVHIASPGDEGRTLRNPDFTRLSVPPAQTDDAPDLIVHDLSDSFLTSLRLGEAPQPTLSIGGDGDSYILTFEFGRDHLTDQAAIAFVTGLARRLADPLHHLA